MTDSYDVTVAYRVYPQVSKTPVVFANDKLKLAELCLRSFCESIGDLKVKLIVLLDACPPDYAKMFRKYFSADDLELIALSGAGNRSTFSRQMQLLLEQTYSELVYFAEDDYYYLPDRFASMARLIRSNSDVHFATPYDHPDYYTKSLHRGTPRWLDFEGRQWRTVGSTTLTFMTTRSILRRAAAVFNSYGRTNWNPDFGVWFSLTKLRMRNPWTLLAGLFGQPLILLTMGTAWYYNWRQLMAGPQWNLWAPKPSIATHMDSQFMAPGYDWPRILAKGVESIG